MKNSIALSAGAFSSDSQKHQPNNMNVEDTAGKSSPIRNIILLIVYLGLLFYSVSLFV